MSIPVYLLGNGWREYPDQFRKHARCFFKQFATPTPCACNSDKPGMQICVAVSDFGRGEGYEMDLQGQLSDGTWIKLHNWSMPERIEDGIALIPRLLATWEYVAAQADANAA